MFVILKKYIYLDIVKPDIFKTSVKTFYIHCKFPLCVLHNVRSVNQAKPGPKEWNHVTSGAWERKPGSFSHTWGEKKGTDHKMSSVLGAILFLSSTQGSLLRAHVDGKREKNWAESLMGKNVCNLALFVFH